MSHVACSEANGVLQKPYWKLKCLAVQPGNWLAPYGALLLHRGGVGGLEGDTHSCMGLRRIPGQVRLPEYAHENVHARTASMLVA